jgi:SAM-dependent methyltransferase
MNGAFTNVYESETRARAYATLGFPGTYYLAFRDLPTLIRRYASGTRALDFGCGTGRSSRFLRDMGFAVTGVDISQPMLNQARALDPAGDYRLVCDSAAFDDLTLSGCGVILSAFTFDNIPTDTAKIDALRRLRRVLAPNGVLILIVSSPAIYVNEWASFSTKDFPENRDARDGDQVRIVMLDVPDRRPVEDVFCTDANYQRLFENAALKLRETLNPLATGEEAIPWVSETTISPWAIYVLTHQTPER